VYDQCSGWQQSLVAGAECGAVDKAASARKVLVQYPVYLYLEFLPLLLLKGLRSQAPGQVQLQQLQ
jgi:hypothetical protein